MDEAFEVKAGKEAAFVYHGRWVIGKIASDQLTLDEGTDCWGYMVNTPVGPIGPILAKDLKDPTKILVKS